ncbi:hypothetical protein LEN26_016037 [Aphanomyces euteiches]|nr:hypothetical protein LEN26_016037 [Aphanomyces euteiches]
MSASSEAVPTGTMEEEMEIRGLVTQTVAWLRLEDDRLWWPVLLCGPRRIEFVSGSSPEDSDNKGDTHAMIVYQFGRHVFHRRHVQTKVREWRGPDHVRMAHGQPRIASKRTSAIMWIFSEAIKEAEEFMSTLHEVNHASPSVNLHIPHLNRIANAKATVKDCWCRLCAAQTIDRCTAFTHSLIKLYGDESGLSVPFSGLHHAMVICAFAIVLSDALAEHSTNLMDLMHHCGHALIWAIDGVAVPDLQNDVMSACQSFVENHLIPAASHSNVVKTIAAFFTQTNYLAEKPWYPDMQRVATGLDHSLVSKLHSISPTLVEEMRLLDELRHRLEDRMAEYTVDWPGLRVVTYDVAFQAGPLGITFFEEENSIRVKALDPQGQGQASNQVSVGDFVVAINGLSTKLIGANGVLAAAVAAPVIITFERMTCLAHPQGRKDPRLNKANVAVRDVQVSVRGRREDENESPLEPLVFSFHVEP